MKMTISFYYQCYHCDNFSTNNEKIYLHHGALEHLYKPLFPNETELRQLNLKPQGKFWEKRLRTEMEAEEHLRRWAEKRIKGELVQMEKIAKIKKSASQISKSRS